jgi:hypothetical protein
MISEVRRCWLTGILSVLVLNGAHTLEWYDCVLALSNLVDRIKWLTPEAYVLGFCQVWQPGLTDDSAVA